jgi:hypothetical protein
VGQQSQRKRTERSSTRFVQKSCLKRKITSYLKLKLELKFFN